MELVPVLKFYRLKEKPFNITADPNFLYMSKKHREALAHISYGIKERKGFLEITGDIGTGKTTVCRSLLSRLDQETRTAFIFNSNLSGIQLLQAIVEDFGLIPKSRTRISLFKELNRFLIEQLALGCNAVLIIDEAQNLTNASLEQVRMLSNLETHKEKLLQIVLVGQPELKEKLKAPSLAQLRQRISIRYHITPLDMEEMREYVDHRLRVAGHDGGELFEASAIEGIYRYSGGVPRVVNIVCDKALLCGYVLEAKTIDGAIIQRCIREIESGTEVGLEHNK